MDEAIRVTPLPIIDRGRHVLEIEVRYNNRSGLEPMYLLGSFGVKKQAGKWTLTPFQMPGIGDLTLQNLPFYTGNVTYAFRVDVPEDGYYALRVSCYKAPVLSVMVDGVDRGIIAFAPERAELGWLEAGEHEITVCVYGNRHNAFGYLHNAVENFTWYGPYAWRTTGKAIIWCAPRG